MPSEKRQRKREGRQARQSYLEAKRRAAQRRRRLVAIVVLVALIAGLAALFSREDGGDEQVTATRSTTTSAPSTNPGAAPAGATYGTTPCPPADAGGPRTTSFPAPFERCVDPSKKYTATMETDVGTITIALDTERAPVTVNNFVALARHHFYDGVPFHRVIPDFVVQGGDAQHGNGTGGPGYKFGDELPDPEDYEEGSLAMANSGPNTNGSQFFIVVSEQGAKNLVQAVGGEAKYSLFGKVTGGIDVVKKIEADGAPSGTPKVVHKIVKVTIAES